MSDALERLTAAYLEGTLDAAGQAELEALLGSDPAAFADQLQVHHLLGQALGEPTSLAPAVVRELRFEQDAPGFARGVVSRIKGGRLWARVASMAAAACVLLVTGWFMLGPASAKPGVLLVVGRLPLDAGDAAVRGRLERLGFAVEVRDAGTARDEDAAGRRLIALSSTALAEELFDVPLELRTRFRNAGVPLLVWEPRLFHDLGLTAGNAHGVDWAAAPDRSRLAILDAGHPLAAGLSGTVEVVARPERLSWGRVGPAALRIATLDGEPGKTALFGYEKGAAMEGGSTAPARRVGFFLFDTTALQLSEDGGRLFDAAVRWCTEGKAR